MSSWLLIDAEAVGTAQDFAGYSGKLVVDVTPGKAALAQPYARAARAVADLHAQSPRAKVWLRISPLDQGCADAELAPLVAARPDGIILPACRSAADVQHLGSKLAVSEAEAGLAGGTIPVVAMVGAAPAAFFAMGSFAGLSRRLAGLACDHAALAATLGLEAADLARSTPAPLSLARALTVLAARSAGVPAIDTAFGLTGAQFDQACRRARRDGFTAMMTRDPAQIPSIQATFGDAAWPGPEG